MDKEIDRVKRGLGKDYNYNYIVKPSFKDKKNTFYDIYSEGDKEGEILGRVKIDKDNVMRYKKRGGTTYKYLKDR